MGRRRFGLATKSKQAKIAKKIREEAEEDASEATADVEPREEVATTVETVDNKESEQTGRYDQDDDGSNLDEDSDAEAEDHGDMVKSLLKHSKYGGEEGKFKWQSVRTGVGQVMSDLTMAKSKSKLRLSKLLKTSKNSEAKKKMRNFEDKKVLEAPLKKPLAQKISRQVNFEEVKEEISKYEPIVKEIRQADQLIFPRPDTKVKFNVAAQLVTSGARTEEVAKEATKKKKLSGLEKEITEQLLFSEENVEFDNRPLTENELTVLKSKSIEEARALHREIQRRRLLTSFQEAKFRRLRRIKSKKYHRILKKEKLKKTVDEFDQIIDAGAEGAEEKLAELDRLRALERASLKHHITGKWAKYNKLRSKYDDTAREEMNKQMALNAELMKKRSLAILEEFGDQEDDEGEEIDFGGGTGTGGQTGKQTEDGEVVTIPNNYNPWISTSKTNKKRKVTVTQTAAERAIPSSKDDNTLERFFAKRIQERMENAAQTEREEAILADALDEKNIIETANFGAPDEDDDLKRTQRRQSRKQQEQPILTTTIQLVEDSAESSDENTEPVSGQKKNVNLKLDSMIVDPKDIKKKKKPAKLVDNGEDQGDDDRHDGNDEDGDHLMGEFDFHNSDMQKYLKEAFIDDDVVQDFLKEKKLKAEEAEGPKVSAYMPGWGTWAGSGIRETNRKRKRLVKQVEKKDKRLDQKIANAIILKETGEVGDKYKIAFKPAFISNVKNFQAELAKPIGTIWNPQTVFKSMTAPKVITRIGTIIEPMESSVVKDHNVKSASLKARVPMRSVRKPLRS